MKNIHVCNASINVKPGGGGGTGHMWGISDLKNSHCGAPKFGQIRSIIPDLPTLDFLTKSELI